MRTLTYALYAHAAPTTPVGGVVVLVDDSDEPEFPKAFYALTDDSDGWVEDWEQVAAFVFDADSTAFADPGPLPDGLPDPPVDLT